MKGMAIPKTMQAVVAHGPEDYRLEEMPVPEAGDGEILIKVEACGICASDIKAYRGAPKIWGGMGNETYIKAPVIAGHEFLGTIVQLGANVEGFEIGDRVISEQIVPCWKCRYCKTGKYWMCQVHDIYGFRPNVNGGMAEYMKFPKDAINHKIPHSIPTERAVLIEPFACAKHCVDRANISNEDIVVLSGSGTLGLGMVGAIKLRNPKQLIVLDVRDDRLELARSFGADLVWNPSRDNVVEKMMEMTDGYGCDVYIEASGHPDSVNQGLQMIRKLGTFVEFSVFKDPVTVDWSIIGDTKELNIYGSHLSPYCYESVIEWIGNGKLPTDGVVTHQFPLSQWKEAFDISERGEGSIKVILTP